jgi:hypothetical protein
LAIARLHVPLLLLALLTKIRLQVDEGRPEAVYIEDADVHCSREAKGQSQLSSRRLLVA